MSGQVTILQLPTAAALTGAESVPVVQNGVTVQTTTSAIAGAGALNYPFLTVNSTAGLTQARYIATGSGLSVTDNGAGSTLQINLTGAVQSLDGASNGLIVKTGTTTVSNTAIAVGSGLTIANADATTGNPTIGLNTNLQNVANLSGTGLVTINGSTFSQVTLAGTSGQISVANGNGTGTPTFSLVSTAVTAGTYTLPTLTVDAYGRLTSASSSSTTGTGGVVALQQSPAFTGTPTAPTAALNTNTTQIATTAFVVNQITGTTAGVATFSAGTTGLTPSTSTTGVVTLGGVLNVVNGGTGTTTSTGTGSLVLSGSPTFTGTPLAPTATSGTNTTQIATTAFVQSAISGYGNGTVTSVSVVSANGFAGTVANASSTPAITLTTSISGVLKGNGTAISAATAGTDYAPATSGTSILYGNGSGGFSNVTVGSGLSFSSGTLSTSGGGGSVTSVSFTGGLISVATATTTPALTVAGTSGGIVYFSSASTWASSAALTANALMIGGGAGAAPSTTTTGTGVLTALGNSTNAASGIVVKDANANLSTNFAFLGYSNVAAAGTTTTLVVSSTPNWIVTGSGGQTYKLPDATTLPVGATYTFNNNQSSGTIVVQNNSSTTVVTVQSGAYVTVVLTANGTAAGTWDYHANIPSGTSWSTNTLSTGSAITSTQAVTGNTLVSTVATGTAPLTVTSTTAVANLTASNLALSAGTGATNYISFSASATGNQPLTTDTSLTYNYTNHAITGGINGGTF